jgi:hypothetical protein
MRIYREDIAALAAQRDLGRKDARQMGMCTRCIVRRARRGKAWCQACADYSARYARERNERRWRHDDPKTSSLPIGRVRLTSAPRRATETPSAPAQMDSVQHLADMRPERPRQLEPFATNTPPSPYRCIGASRGGLRSWDWPMRWDGLFGEPDDD